MKVIPKLLLALSAQIFFSSAVLALPPEWKMIPASSSLRFTATQNGAPVKGEFKKFTGEFNFDLDMLSKSKIKIVIDMNSLTTSYSDLTLTLQAPDWFNIKVFPDAVFESSEFTKTGDREYEAKGSLTIRDKTVPVILKFSAEQPTKTNALVKGYTTINRTAFGVGQGEWASTNEIKDDVRVDFVVSATK